MTETGGKNKAANELLFLLLAGVVGFLVVLVTNVPLRSANADLRARRSELATRITRLAEEHERLKRECRAVEDDALYVEYRLRERSFRRPGEIIYRQGGRR